MASNDAHRYFLQPSANVVFQEEDESESDIDVVNDEPDVDVENVQDGRHTLKTPAAEDADDVAQESTDSEQCM